MSMPLSGVKKRGLKDRAGTRYRISRRSQKGAATFSSVGGLSAVAVVSFLEEVWVAPFCPPLPPFPLDRLSRHTKVRDNI